MKKRIALMLISSGIIFASAFGATSASWAVTDNADTFGVKISTSVPASKHSVKFYTTFDGTDWGDDVDFTVDDGSTVVAPTVTKTGYTVKGWTMFKPSLTIYAPDYDLDEINSLAIDQDYTFYPIIESNNNRVWIHDLGYVGDVDTDITLDVNTIGQTLIGKEYIGVTDGVCSPIASWNNNRSLYSSSGIYKFSNKDGAASCSRKVTISTTNVTWWTGDSAITKIHVWDGSGNSHDYEILNSSFSATSHTATIYIDATCENLMVMRINPNNKSEVWNQTVDAKITSKGSGSETYSKNHATFYIESSGGDKSKNYSWY